MNFIRSKAFFIASLVMLLQATVYYSLAGVEVIPTITPWNRFPTEIADWRAVTDIPMQSEVLAALKPDDYLEREYVSPRSRAGLNLFVGYFNSRRNGRAPHSPQWCLPGAGWKTVSTKVISIPIPGERAALPANEYIVKSELGYCIVLYWYHQGGRVLANEIEAQFYAIPEMLMHQRTDIALVRIMTPVAGDDIEGARPVSVEFAQAVFPLIRKQIQ